jgi:tetratricopeptide (TPR) repeat protein
MTLSKMQIGVIAGAVLLLFSLVLMGQQGYTTPTTKKGEPKKGEPEDILTEEVVLAQARNSLDSSQQVWLAELDRQKEQAPTITKEAEVLKLLSRTWFEYTNYIVSGYYARKAAELLQTGDAWAIAGSTYGTAYSASKERTEKKLAAKQAINAFAKAKELQPDVLKHAVNEGVMYLELSAVDASFPPMKGVRMLQALAAKHPNNVMIMMKLGRLSANQTRDFAKAKPRFERVLAIAKTQAVSEEILLEANTFLIECYKRESNKEKVLFHFDEAIKLSASSRAFQEKMIQGKQNYIETKIK